LLLGAAGIVWHGAWWLLLAEVIVYLLASLAAGLQATTRAKASPLMILFMPPVFATIHLTWGSSFLFRLLRKQRQSK
jgi:thiosulfate reductase cytochrome b subunit